MIEERLKNHKENIARLQLNLLNIDNLDREIIEELCLPASVVTDMPRSLSNQFSSKTEDAAICREIWKSKSYDDIMKQSKEIARIETVLKTLARLDMLLIDLRYFQNCTWGLTAIMYAKHAGIGYISKEALKKQKKRILLKLETLLGE